MSASTLAHRVTSIRPLNAELLKGDRITPDHPLFGLIWINPERLHGAPCFYGTRVPIQNLFDSLAAGETVAEFLDGFEGVTAEQVAAVIELAGNDLLAHIEQS
jgi:uncharacterized protein (DUF433 family)